MTATQMIPAVGTLVAVRFEELHINCTVTDVKHVWGKVRIQITPAKGEGYQWVELSRVTRIDTQDPRNAHLDNRVQLS